MHKNPLGMCIGNLPATVKDIPPKEADKWRYIDLGLSGFAKSGETMTVRMDEDRSFFLIQEGGEKSLILKPALKSPAWAFIALTGEVKTVRWMCVADSSDSAAKDSEGSGAVKKVQATRSAADFLESTFDLEFGTTVFYQSSPSGHSSKMPLVCIIFLLILVLAVFLHIFLC